MNNAYEVLTGLNYKDIRAEPGDVVTDLPAQSAKWLLAQGHIRPVQESDD